MRNTRRVTENRNTRVDRDRGGSCGRRRVKASLRLTAALLAAVLICASSAVWTADGCYAASSKTSKFSSMTAKQFNQYLIDQGFPASYRAKLKALHKAHPEWVFVAKNTGIKWSTAVSRESRDGVSLVSSSHPLSYRSLDSDSYSGGSYVKVYKSSTAGTVLTRIKPGLYVTLVTEVWKGRTRWNEVKLNSGKTGWVKGSTFIQKHPDSLAGTVNSSCVNIRKGAGTDSSVIKSLAQGTAVEVVLSVKDKNGDKWYKIRYSDGYAYIMAKYVTLPSDGSKAASSLTGTVCFISGGTFKAKDGSSWFNASDDAIAYFMDPRNFLDDDRIYMFENLSYCSDYQTKSVVSRVLKPTKLPGYGFTAQIFVKAGAKYKISPVHLASRARQETGGGSIAISGYKYNGKKVYNPFNIGASSGSNPVMNGLAYAYLHGWTTPAKAVNGGASFLAGNYINKGQNSIYFQRFNVANGILLLGYHQYMTNLLAPYSEAYSMGESYESYGITGEALTFIIPVFKGMPTSTSLPQ